VIEPNILLVVGIPLSAALLLALIPSYRAGAACNILASAATLASALLLFRAPPIRDDIFIIDDFNIYLIVLNSFVGFTTSLFSASYIGHEIAAGKLTRSMLRFYHSMYQAMIGSMGLALVSNDMGLMWVGLEVATLVTVMMVGIYRTPSAIEAAWKYFILGSVGIALAFFGTILLYLSAQGALGDGLPALAWHRLQLESARLDPALLSLAFVFFLVGYGTKIGLAPLHAWLPDAHAEGPTPISAVLSGLLLNVALYALLRCKMILAANHATIETAPIMMVMGLASLLFAAFMLYRRNDIKRLFAYSSIEHMGLITFAFGMGGPLANLAGLLQMTMHSLTKSGIFFAVGHVVQAKNTQHLPDIRGLSVSHPRLAWGLGLGVLAIAGLPPFGVFMSEFLLVTTTFARQPLLALVLVAGLIVAFGALLLRLQHIMLGEPSANNHPVQASSLPIFAHLALVLVGGLYLPPPLLHWFRQVAALLG
jgi:hydrogenase-4 component F